MNSTVYVSLGSNVEATKNIRIAIQQMRAFFGPLELSPVYESASFGFKGDDFLNLVAAMGTELSVYEVVKELRAIEDRLGRDRSQGRFSKRPIDLDILLYDNLELDSDGIQLPRHEIAESAYVLKPLSDLAPQRLHPKLKQSYQALWFAMAPDALRLDVYSLDLS